MVLYCLREDNIFKEDIGNYLSYGIDIFNELSQIPVRSILDITTKKEPLENLIYLCNKLQADIIHIDDIIDNFLAQLSLEGELNSIRN